MANKPGGQMGLKAQTLTIGEDMRELDLLTLRWVELQVRDMTLSVCFQAKMSLGVAGAEEEQQLRAAWAQIKSKAVAAAGPRYFLLNSDAFLTLVIWVPEDTPVKDKFRYTHSVGQLKSVFARKEWKEFRPEDEKELCYESWFESVRLMTGEERFAAMTREEQALFDVVAQEKLVVQSAPMMLPGMSAGNMAVKLSSEAEAALEAGLQPGEALLFVILPDNSVSLLREKKKVGTNFSTPLIAELKMDQVAYVLMRAADGEYDLVMWAPDEAPGKQKMKVSTLKGGLLATLGTKDIKPTTCECHDTDDLRDFEKEGRKVRAAMGLPMGGMRR